MPYISEQKTDILVCKQLSAAEFLCVVIVDRPHKADRCRSGSERGKHEKPAMTRAHQKAGIYDHSAQSQEEQ